jgi:hypothetical protein
LTKLHFKSDKIKLESEKKLFSDKITLLVRQKKICPTKCNLRRQNVILLDKMTFLFRQNTFLVRQNAIMSEKFTFLVHQNIFLV